METHAAESGEPRGERHASEEGQKRAQNAYRHRTDILRPSYFQNIQKNTGGKPHLTHLLLHGKPHCDFRQGAGRCSIQGLPLWGSCARCSWSHGPFPLFNLAGRLRRRRMTRVLVVDDDPEIRAVFTHFLELEQMEVQTAGNVRTAQRNMKETKFDVVITDLIMEDQDSLDLISAVRKSHPNTRLIAISGGGLGSPDTYLAMGGGARSERCSLGGFPARGRNPGHAHAATATRSRGGAQSSNRRSAHGRGPRTHPGGSRTGRCCHDADSRQALRIVVTTREGAEWILPEGALDPQRTSWQHSLPE